MKIKDFSYLISTYTPTGWSYWAGLYRSMYNAEKTINDTMLLVVPKVWPVEWRFGCHYDIQFELWFGKVVLLKQTTGTTQQHLPYSGLELIDALHSDIKVVVSLMSQSDSFQMLAPLPIAEFYDSPDGQSVNSQVWCRVPVSMRIFNNFTNGFDYDLDQQFNAGDNGDIIITNDSGVPLTDESGNYITTG